MDPKELVAAVAAHGSEDVAREAFAVHADEHGLRGGDVAEGQRQMARVVELGPEHVEHEIAVRGRELHAEFLLHELFRFAAVFDERGDGAELEPESLLECREVVQTCHRAVVLRDLADDRRGLKPRQTRQVHGRLRVARALKHAAGTRRDREHVPGDAEVFAFRRRVEQRFDRGGAVGRADAGGPGEHVDALGERRLEVVGGRRAVDAEFLRPRLGDGGADESARMGDHEIHMFRRDLFRRAHQIAFVLAFLVVRNDHEPACAHVLQDAFHGVEPAVHSRLTS